MSPKPDRGHQANHASPPPSATWVRRDSARPSRATIFSGRLKAGYLLLEVLLALAILTIVVVVVFRIIQTTLETTAQVTFIEAQQEKVDGVAELLRQNFAAMPGVTLFQTRTDHGALELVFKKAPFTFSLNPDGAQFGTVMVAGKPQPNGKFTLCVLQEPETLSDNKVESAAQDPSRWVALVSDLTQLSWRFYDPQATKWQDAWADVARKPSLVELTFQIAGKPQVIREIFAWPVAQAKI